MNIEEKDARQKDKIIIEFTEENLQEFLTEYYATHRKTKKTYYKRTYCKEYE